MTTKRVYLHFHAFAYAYRHGAEDQAHAEAYAAWYLARHPDGRIGHLEAYPWWRANVETVATCLGVPVTMAELRRISADGV